MAVHSRVSEGLIQYAHGAVKRDNRIGKPVNVKEIVTDSHQAGMSQRQQKRHDLQEAKALRARLLEIITKGFDLHAIVLRRGQKYTLEGQIFEHGGSGPNSDGLVHDPDKDY